VARDATQRWTGQRLGQTPLDNYHPERQPMGIHSPGELATVLEDITNHRFSWHAAGALQRGLGEVSQGRPAACLISGRADAEWHWIQMTGRNGGNVNLSSWGSEYSVAPAAVDPFLRVVLCDDGPR
jgi:hypothetical protein